MYCNTVNTEADRRVQPEEVSLKQTLMRFAKMWVGNVTQCREHLLNLCKALV
jgi:hypothetical protein